MSRSGYSDVINRGNEPAYPVQRQSFADQVGRPITIIEQFGLTKREAFAMAAMQGLLPVCGCDSLLIKPCVEFSVRYADALIDKLAKESQ
jgi:hypothetical protein